jgi:putative SOS response-associated peptidase YedK
MCVRYTLHDSDAALAAISQALARKLAPPEWAKPKYNVTLTHVMPVVATGESGPEVRGMMWGLVPFYERKKPQKRMLPNAKAETAATGAAFKQAIAKRRCLVPANGFYEWQTVGKLKYPHLFTLKNEEPFAFAGIWEPSEDDMPETYAILTTEPNALVAPIHNRMPVLLSQGTAARWIGSEPLEEKEYRELTRPLDPALMSERPVSRFVNNSRNEGPECIEPPKDEPDEPNLFG